MIESKYKIYTIFLYSLIAISIVSTLSSCNVDLKDISIKKIFSRNAERKQQEKEILKGYAIIVDSTPLLKQTSNILLSVQAIHSFSKKKGYLIYPITKDESKKLEEDDFVHTIRPASSQYAPSHSLKFLKSFDLASNYLDSNKYYLFLNISILLDTPIREKPDYNSKKIENIPSHTNTKVISPLFTPFDYNISTKKYFNVLSLSEILDLRIDETSTIEGYWLEVQYKKKKKYVRGWVRWDEKTMQVHDTTPASITHKKDALFSLYRLVNSYPGWSTHSIETDQLPSVIANADQTMSYMTMSLSSKTNFFNNNLELRQNDSKNISYTIPLNYLWIINDKVAVIPKDSITLYWNEFPPRVSIQYAKSTKIGFFPVNNINEINIAGNDAALRKEKQHDLFSTLLDKANFSLEIYWESQLYGKMIITPHQQIDNYKMNFTWKIPPEISEIYFPPYTHTVQGVLSQTHSFAPYTDNDADGIITLTNNLPIRNTMYMSYKIIDDSHVALQFIPEAHTLLDSDKDFVITASPVLPKMIFKKRSVF